MMSHATPPPLPGSTVQNGPTPLPVLTIPGASAALPPPPAPSASPVPPPPPLPDPREDKRFKPNWVAGVCWIVASVLYVALVGVNGKPAANAGAFVAAVLGSGLALGALTGVVVAAMRRLGGMSNAKANVAFSICVFALAAMSAMGNLSIRQQANAAQSPSAAVAPAPLAASPSPAAAAPPIVASVTKMTHNEVAVLAKLHEIRKAVDAYRVRNKRPPALRQIASLPPNPLTGQKAVAKAGAATLAAHGWSYDEATGKIRIVLPTGKTVAGLAANDIERAK
jgi:hypothetical protein